MIITQYQSKFFLALYFYANVFTLGELVELVSDLSPGDFLCIFFLHIIGTKIININFIIKNINKAN